MQEKEVTKTDEKAKLPAILGAASSMFLDAQKFEHAQRVANLLSSSNLVPAHFRGRENLANAVIALNLAERMQVDPFMLMQNMYVVHGRPGLEGKLIIALINQSRRFGTLKFDMEKNGQGEVIKCTAYATDKETGDRVEGPPVTWETVVLEGWNKDKKARDGGTIKSKWNTMRPVMFMYRSATFFGRIYCPEKLMGMQTREEIEDVVELVEEANGTYSMEASESPEAISDLIHQKPPEEASPEAPATTSQGATGEASGTEEGQKATGQNFANITGMMLSKFLKLRTTGLENFVAEHKAVFPGWPESVQKIVLNKLAAQEDWQPLIDALVPPKKAPEPVSEEENNSKFVPCPSNSGMPMAGKRVPPQVVCETQCPQEKRSNCDPYLLFQDSQRGGLVGGNQDQQSLLE